MLSSPAGRPGAPAMRQAERGTELDDLPEEILVGKILVLLPPKDVGRCRAVRSSWRSATSTPEFMLDHHRRQPSLPIVDIYGDRPGVLRDPVDNMSYQRLWPSLLPPWYGIHAAGHGFLVVSHYQLGFGYHICNPAIRQIALLPQPKFRSKNAILGLYRHGATGEYRMLWASGCGNNETTMLYVLKVGDDESRNIGLSTVSPPSLQHAVLDALPRGPYTAYNPPVHHRGSLHWTPTCRADIVVFDIATESFRLMRSATNSHSLENLFELEEKLAFSSHDSRSTCMDVWVMEDYAAERWDLKYRIDVSSIQASLPLNLASFWKENKRRKGMGTDVAPTTRFLSELVMVNERELLAGFSDKQVLRCNIDGKLLGMANVMGQCYMELTPYRFKQSILPIPLS